MNQILSVLAAIAIGVAIRFIYDFLVKPLFTKKSSPPDFEIQDKDKRKKLKKEAKARKKASKK